MSSMVCRHVCRWIWQFPAWATAKGSCGPYRTCATTARPTRMIPFQSLPQAHQPRHPCTKARWASMHACVDSGYISVHVLSTADQLKQMGSLRTTSLQGEPCG